MGSDWGSDADCRHVAERVAVLCRFVGAPPMLVGACVVTAEQT